MKKQQKSVLGKGLNALISSKKKTENNVTKTEDTNTKNKIIEIEISKIEPTKSQPRNIFEKEKLEELSSSIKSHGVIQPIMVRKKNNTYKIVYGERRYRAAKLLNLKKIPVITIDTDDKNAFEIALIENIQRENLNAIEEGESYIRLIDDFKLTQEEVAKRVGKSRSAITNSIRLLKLPLAIQEFLITKKLSMGHVRALLSIENIEKQLSLANNAVKNNFSVRQLESLASKNSEINENKKKKNHTITNDVEINHLIESLQHKFCCKVALNGSAKKGKLMFEYHSKDELDRLIELMSLDDIT